MLTLKQLSADESTDVTWATCC